MQLSIFSSLIREISPGIDVSRLREEFLATGSKTNADKLQAMVLRMGLGGQQARDEAAIRIAAERTVQLAATFRLLRCIQSTQKLFGTDLETIELRPFDDECVQFAVVVESFAYLCISLNAKHKSSTRQHHCVCLQAACGV